MPRYYNYLQLHSQFFLLISPPSQRRGKDKEGEGQRDKAKG